MGNVQVSRGKNISPEVRFFSPERPGLYILEGPVCGLRRGVVRFIPQFVTTDCAG